ncbi:MAG: ABC transporter permease [Verrucomicrobiales bacterium]|nr:ABC transporter permease [Verrucomicrobiales bacterium]
MLGVLLLLGAYYAVVTLRDHHPAGADAARQIATELLRDALSPPSVLIVAGTGTEDPAFASTLEAELQRRGARVAARVIGEPRDARLALEKLATEGSPLGAIATTTECAAWPVLSNVGRRFPVLGEPKLVSPHPYRWPTFLTRDNLLNIANQIAVVAILAVGMTVVIITGGIDLSVGSLIALSAVVVTVLIRDVAGGIAASGAMLWACSAAGVALCLLVGTASGALVAWCKVPPFIATLAVMQVASGLAFIVAQGGSIYEVPDTFTALGRGTLMFGLPNAVLLMLVLYAGTHALMSRTVLGRRIYAVGGNPEAARLSGVNLSVILIFAYGFCGAMAGLGGVLQASQLKSGAPNYGVMYELYAIAAVVVGGTSLSGGEGRVLGTLIGAFIIAVIQNGMNLTGVQSYQQKVVLGLVILGAVLLDLLKKRDWKRLFQRRANPSAQSSSEK